MRRLTSVRSGVFIPTRPPDLGTPHFALHRPSCGPVSTLLLAQRSRPGLIGRTPLANEPAEVVHSLRGRSRGAPLRHAGRSLAAAGDGLVSALSPPPPNLRPGAPVQRVCGRRKLRPRHRRLAALQPGADSGLRCASGRLGSTVRLRPGRFAPFWVWINHGGLHSHQIERHALTSNSPSIIGTPVRRSILHRPACNSGCGIARAIFDG